MYFWRVEIVEIVLMIQLRVRTNSLINDLKNYFKINLNSVNLTKNPCLYPKLECKLSHVLKRMLDKMNGYRCTYGTLY